MTEEELERLADEASTVYVLGWLAAGYGTIALVAGVILGLLGWGIRLL